MRQGWEWTFLRCCLGLTWLTTVLWISIPDYPYAWPIWYWFAMDPNGYLHEVWYASATFTSLITLTYFWQFLPRVLAHMPQIRSRRLRLE